MQYNSHREAFPYNMLDLTRSLFETTLFSPFGQSLATQSHVVTYQQILAAATQAASNQDYNLVLAHIPTPHAPHAYNRNTKQFTRRNSAISGYWDSLALADMTLASIRQAMERAGVWESTTILATSDHSYREELDGKLDTRIPFLLRLAGQAQGLSYEAPFNTVLAHPLMLAILKEELRTPQAVKQWIEQHRSEVKLQ